VFAEYIDGPAADRLSIGDDVLLAFMRNCGFGDVPDAFIYSRNVIGL